jgi:hypothetical protein
MFIIDQTNIRIAVSGFIVILSITLNLAIPFPRSNLVGNSLIALLLLGSFAFSNLLMGIPNETGFANKLTFLLIGISIIFSGLTFLVPKNYEATIAPGFFIIIMVWWGSCLYFIRSRILRRKAGQRAFYENGS